MTTKYKPHFKQAIKIIERRALGTIIGTVERMSEEVIERTPVRSGQARGNWNAALNSPPDGFDPDRLDPDGGETIERVKAVAEQMKLGDTFRLANSAPHIHRLENGASDQQPAGMVDVTLAQLPRIVQGEAAKQRRGRS